MSRWSRALGFPPALLTKDRGGWRVEVWDCRRGGKQGVVTNVSQLERKGRMGEIMEADLKKALGKYAADEMGEEGMEGDP